MSKLADEMRAMIASTFSHVDGRDLLAELKPNHWHYCDIRVRINGQWEEFEGDWLKRLMKARDEAMLAAAPSEPSRDAAGSSRHRAGTARRKRTG